MAAREYLSDKDRFADVEFDRFSAELGLVLKYVKHSKNKDDLSRMVGEDARYRESREEGEHSNLLANARSLIANTGWDAMEALRMIGGPEDDRPAVAWEVGAL